MPVCLLLAAVCVAADARDPVHARIDRHIAAGYADYEKFAAPLADDAAFLRRVTLDITGTIPTTDEVRAFVADQSPGKRARVVNELVNSHGYVRRMTWFLDVTLMERRPDAKVPRGEWEAYLKTAIAENRPYNELIREMLSNDGTDAKTRAAAKFFLDRDLEPHLVTRDIGRIFLGRNMECAQCHDHPVVTDYLQADYYGIQAFLNRSYLFPNAKDAKAVVAEKADGEVAFSSVFVETKEQKTITPKLPGMKPLPEPKVEKGKEYKVKPAKNVRPVPTYSRFSRLGDAITSVENTAFARTAVNRIWAMMLGRGLIDSPEWDHASNPPSHPELLEMLTTEFVQRNYDIKWLVREIALSDTYQRSSVVPDSLKDFETIPADRYLVGIVKPLTPEQLAYAVSEASGQTDADREVIKKLGPKGTPQMIDARIDRRVLAFRKMFATRVGEPDDEFTATLDQTLFLKFSAAVRGPMKVRAAELAKITDNAELTEELFLSVLSRRPTADEAKDVAELLKAVPDRNEALAELTWALVASAEFRFNH